MDNQIHPFYLVFIKEIPTFDTILRINDNKHLYNSIKLIKLI